MSRDSKRTFRLSAKKQALLEKMLTQEGIAPTKASFISPRTHSENIPLSFAQQRMWLLHQIDPTSPAYNLVTAVRLHGQLHVRILEQCFQHIFTRHESLRTTFPVINQEPIQHIAATGDPNITLIDIHAFPEQQREHIALQLVRDYTQQPFRLDVGPLTRIVLIQLTEKDTLLLLVMHHIISDGWSIGVLIREMTTLYTAYINGDTVRLSELPIQYADFALWQRQWLEEQALQEQMRYWKEYLGSNPALLQLPTDYPRSSTLNSQGAIHSFILPKQLVASLNELSEQTHVTLFMMLLAAFNVLLSRYSRQDDISVGSPIANRNRSETEGLIGFFVNTLVFRTHLRNDLPFRSLLEQVRRNTTAAYDHQDVPFEQLVQELQPERHLSHTPLFQVMFDFSPLLPPIAVPYLRLEPYTFDTGTAKFDLTLSLEETDVGVQGTWGYRTDLFETHTVERMHRHFQNLLTSIVADSDQSVGALSILSDAEQQQLLIDWNATSKTYPYHTTVADLVIAQATQTPDAVALTCGDLSLTYTELVQRAAQLAIKLHSSGVTAEICVGVLAERSIEFVIGVFGVLMAGGTYVPLPSDAPSNRLEWILKNAQVHIVVTYTTVCHHLPQSTIPVLCIDDLPSSSTQSFAALPFTATPDQLAYIIYTSGSTGTPKGVAIPHRGLMNLVNWHHQTFAITAHDRATLIASVGFDASVWELWPYLTIGASIVIPPEEVRTMPTELRDWLITQQISITFVPTPVTEAIQDITWPSTIPLRVLLTGGDVLHQGPRDAQSFAVINNYGPTENTVVTTSSIAYPPDLLYRPPPIGKAIYNTQLYIIDPCGQLTPIGVPGELLIGGVGLARGYVGAPSLTADRFIPHPWSNMPGTRLYRTGDLVRYRTDGNLDFLGRIDQQIKLRGFRIELGEIEAVLRRHPCVQDTIVICERRTVINDRLVAYIVLNLDEDEPVPDWYQFLHTTLPEYMIPAVFVELAHLPLTPNGKIDRSALPSPAEMHDAQQVDVTQPRNPTEELISVIWSAVLDMDNVGVEENFFSLGGHSLLATQVIARIRDVYDVEVPLKALFENPTIASLAKYVVQIQQMQQKTVRPPLLPASRTHPIPLSFAQQRLWFLDQLQPHNAAYNIPLVIQLQGHLHYTALRQSFVDLIHRHEALRTVFLLDDSQPTQYITQQIITDLPLIDLSNLNQEVRETITSNLVATEAERPFNLQQGPLVCTTLIRWAPNHHILQLTMHHIVSDGWSQDILIRDLIGLYHTHAYQQPLTLPNLPIQYADFAIWQRQWLQGFILDDQLNYWKKQLADTAPELALPFDRPRPPMQTFQGLAYSGRQSEIASAQIRRISQQENATLFMTLLAGWYVLLYRYTGQADMCIGTPIANRIHSGIEDLIGCFVNTLVLRLDLGGSPTFRVVMQRIRDVTINAYMHQDVPFEMVVDALQPIRDLSMSPLFQVMFVLQTNHAVPSKHHINELIISPYETVSSLSKFDMTLTINDTASHFDYDLEYACDLFEHSTIERMMAHFVRLIELLGTNPDQVIDNIVFLTDVEQQQLVVDWNATNNPYPEHQTMHGLLVAQASSTPDSIAVVDGTNQVTYQALDQWSNQLAHELHMAGVQLESRVGICLERSPALIVGMLGILKVGAVYVPLDSAYPEERLAFMIEDTSTQLVITEPHLIKVLPSQSITPVYLDSAWFVRHCRAVAPMAITTTAVLPAYIIYTSGSTGRPKGVVITHRNAVSLISWAHTVFSSRDLSGVFAATSICFDLSIFELFVPLSSGGTIILGETALALRDLPQTTTITLLNTVPSAIEALLQQRAIPTTVRTVNLAGEALSRHVVQQLYDLGHIQQVLNLYGPSEDTTYSTWAVIPHDEQDAPAIGRPIANSQAYVLDGHGHPVPIGVIGELYLGGAGVAQGYLHRPSVTADRFLPNPFGGKVGTRLYRTGDLVRYQQDGQLAFLGRIDHQIKLHGYRIELGEIESVLQQHPAVQDAVVIAREDSPGNPSVVGYIVAASHEGQVVPLLRTALSQRLPGYMMPSALIVLDEFPLTPNGKINRQALPRPDNLEAIDDGSVLDARDTTEFQLIQIVEETLHTSVRDITSNFFDIGGNSLLAVRLIAKLEEVFGCKLPLTTPFQAPTVEQLADIIRQQTSLQDESPLVGLKTSGTNIPFICVHSANGILLNYLDLVRHIDREQPIYGLQSPALNLQVQPCCDVTTMASQYVSALRTMQPNGPYLLGGWSFGGIVAFEMAQQLSAQGQEVPIVVLIDTVAPALRTTSLVDQQSFEVNINDNALWLAELADSIEHVRGVDLGLSYDELTQYDEQMVFDYFLDRLQASGLLPHSSGLTQLQALIEVSKANIQAMVKYVPQPYHGNIILFRSAHTVDVADEQSVLPEAYLSMIAPHLNDPLLGWSQWCTASVDVHVIPGTHATMLIEPHVQELAKHLMTCLRLVSSP